MSKEELKPCPFCASENVMIDDLFDNGTHTVFCGDCCSKSPNCCDYDDAVDSWNTRALQSEWVSVADRVPSDNKIVSVCGGDVESLLGCSSAGYYSEVYSCFIVILESDVLELCEATHWMPMPKPPKGA